MQSSQGIAHKNGLSSLEHDIDDLDAEDVKGNFKNLMNGVPARIASKTVENVSKVARDLPKQIKDAPMVSVGVGAGIVGLAIALFVVPMALAPSSRMKRVEKFIGKKNVKMIKKQLRAFGF